MRIINVGGIFSKGFNINYEKKKLATVRRHDRYQ